MEKSPKTALIPFAVPLGLLSVTAVLIIYRMVAAPHPELVAAGAMIASALFSTLLIEGVSRVERKRIETEPPEGMPPEAASLIGATTFALVRSTELALAVSMSFGALALTFTQELPVRPFLAILIGSVAVSLSTGIARLRRCQRDLAARNLPGLEGWNGVFYKNPKDERLWVPKISGLGYTLNFAHSSAWPVLIALLAVPVIGLILAGYQALR